MPIYTKTAAEVFNPVDGGGLPRGADMEEAQVWGTEVESRVEEIATSTQSQIDAIQAEVDSATSVLSQPNAYEAWWPVKRTLALENADISILFLGDSTSNDAGELAYKMAATLFAAYPTWTVKYYTFDFISGAWNSPTTLKTGTGARTIHFKNVSTNGATLDEFTGRNRATIVGGGFSLIIINHGHNYNAYQNVGSYGYSEEDAYYRLDESIEDIVYSITDAPIIVSLQNPSLSALNTPQDERCHRAWGKIAQRRGGISLVDCRRVYLENNKPAGWYGDDLHPLPGGGGVDASVAEHLRCFNTSKGRFTSPPRMRQVCKRTSYFDSKNLLPNSRFLSFTGGVPNSWTASPGSGTCSEETSDVSWFSPKACKLINQKYISYTLSDTILNVVRGRTVGFAALLKVDGGSEVDGVGYFRINGGLGGEAHNGGINTPALKYAWHRHEYGYANGNYAWKFVQEKIPYNAASGSVQVLLYGGGVADTHGRYALWAACGMFLQEDFEKFDTWF